jgi:hypothetical protein
MATHLLTRYLSENCLRCLACYTRHLICPIKQIFVAILYQTLLSYQREKERKFFISPPSVCYSRVTKLEHSARRSTEGGIIFLFNFLVISSPFICSWVVQVIKLWLSVAPSPTSGGRQLKEIIILCFVYAAFKLKARTHKIIYFLLFSIKKINWAPVYAKIEN